MAALAEGVLGALSGSEPVNTYSTAPTSADAPPLNLDEVISRSTMGQPCRFVVAGGNQQEIAETVAWCREHGISGFVLVGPKDETTALLKGVGVDPGQVEIVEADDVVAGALELVKGQPHTALVKGKCNTAALLKGVLDCLPHDHRPFLSHVAVVENPIAGRLVGISDGGLNLELDLQKKIGLIENAVPMFRALGVKQPHVLLAAGMEDKGQDVPSIADAREIVRRHREGEWADCVIDGPFGIDVGLNSEAAALKGITSPVAGRADIIITPNLESCNFSVKMAIAYTGRPWAGLVVGGPFPVVLGSRADDAPSRVASVALAQLVAIGLGK
jgi:phosphate butyryltransferase